MYMFLDCLQWLFVQILNDKRRMDSIFRAREAIDSHLPQSAETLLKLQHGTAQIQI